MDFNLSHQGSHKAEPFHIQRLAANNRRRPTIPVGWHCSDRPLCDAGTHAPTIPRTPSSCCADSCARVQSPLASHGIPTSARESPQAAWMRRAIGGIPRRSSRCFVKQSLAALGSISSILQKMMPTGCWLQTCRCLTGSIPLSKVLPLIDRTS
jgi:hypothetical protein